MAKKKLKGDELLIEAITTGIFEKKGTFVVKLDMRKLDNRVCDYFIICHGGSATQVDALSYSVVDTVRKSAGEKPLHTEGLENCFWVLLDYGSVIVHIFQEEYRNFYNLEALWADADRETVIDPVSLKD
ncbi:MAG: ribosome silencing factor [Bacteroidales bacterium]|nr:ribosome silencing factor [Bacteroidales bacterium]